MGWLPCASALAQRQGESYSRSDLNWTKQFDTVSEAVAKRRAKSAVIAMARWS